MKTAVLQFSGTQKLRRERLTISVIEGANRSRQDFTSHVGTGSNRQEALEDSRTHLSSGKMGFLGQVYPHAQIWAYFMEWSVLTGRDRQGHTQFRRVTESTLHP